MYSKLSKRLKSGEANALGLVEDAQGTLQREMMSYSAITGRLYVCVWGQEAEKKQNVFHNHKWRAVVHDQHNRYNTVTQRICSAAFTVLTGLM